MPVSRRIALGLIAGGLASRASGSFGIPVRIDRGQLTQGGWAIGRVLRDQQTPPPTRQLWLDGKPIERATDGEFLIAFDRDAASTAHLELRHGEENEVSVALTIAPRQWQIEQVDAPLRPPAVPSDEFLKLRAAELARIAAARALTTAAEGWRQAMIRPVPGRISGRFGAQRIYRGEPGAYHGGLDLASPAGTPILAPADGVVILAAEQPFTLEGRLLMLDHGMGLSSALLHCSAHAVREGDAVKQGQPVASVGMTGRATGPHLHWGLRWREARLDPLLFLGEG